MAQSRPRRRGDRAARTPSARGSSAAKYNAAYTAKKDFIARPNAFLARCLKRLCPSAPLRAVSQRPPRTRRALDIGLGQGRNAILLAKNGYATTGIDRSEVGVQAARRMAEARGLSITAIVADTRRYDFGKNRWDLIALLYYPQPMILIERLKAAVRPGGCIVVERFTSVTDANPRDDREQRKHSPMLRAFVDWRVLHYEHDEFRSDWHWDGESATGAIVRLLARKPWRG